MAKILLILKPLILENISHTYVGYRKEWKVYRIDIIQMNKIDWDEFKRILLEIAIENPETSQVAIENFTTIQGIDDTEEYGKKIKLIPEWMKKNLSETPKVVRFNRINEQAKLTSEIVENLPTSPWWEKSLDELQIDPSWKDIFIREFALPYFAEVKEPGMDKSIITFLKEEDAYLQTRKDMYIFPPQKYLFEAFRLTKLDDIKVVILGQDPYHGDGQAHGLAFSNPDGVTPQPSLRNIFKEIESEKNVFFVRKSDKVNNLSYWAKQGVLLLNCALTVRKGCPASHVNIWEPFTDVIIYEIVSRLTNVVFMLWGSFAEGKKDLIKGKRHLVLKASHPSPLSYNKGDDKFSECKHFSKANEYLMHVGKQPIDWSLGF